MAPVRPVGISNPILQAQNNRADFARVYCSGITFIDLDGVKGLQKIARIHFDLELTEIDIISQCTSLTKLTIKDPSFTDDDLSKLPKSLQELDIRQAGLINPQFMHLTHLQKLVLRHCYQLINPNFNGLINLQTLYFDDCDALIEPNVNCLDNLQNLSFAHCDKINPRVEKLPKLRTLEIESCRKFVNCNFNGLINLELLRFSSCEALPIYSGLKQLKTLDLSRSQIVHFDLTGLDNLETFDISASYGLKSLNVRGLPKLHSINATSCGALRNTNFEDLPNVDTLQMSCCTVLEKPTFRDLPKLRLLNLYSTPLEGQKQKILDNLAIAG